MTRVVKTVAALARYVARQKRDGKSIGLVPTMGALHAGHLALIRRSVKENDRTVVSVFVNPTQFGPNEDLKTYPRPFARDREACRSAGVDVVFAPNVDEMYPPGATTTVDVGKLATVLCGRSRPGHFRGVTTVCAKLFAMSRCDRAYFGEKDYQQLVVIRKMVAELNMSLRVVGCPLVREEDGLALSSRNRYLNAEARAQAVVLHRSLVTARHMIARDGVTEARAVVRGMRRILRTARAAKIDYVAVVDPVTLEPVPRIRGEVRIVLAVFVDGTRLIDNIGAKPRRDATRKRGAKKRTGPGFP